MPESFKIYCDFGVEMELLAKPELLESMLVEHGESLSQIDRENIKELIKKAKTLNQYQKDIDAKDYSKSFVFMKITPKKVEPMYMYGSHVPSDTINEISVCFAKAQDGKWVPDEDNVILRVAISERGLSDMTFDREKYKGEPANIIELNGVPLPKYEPKQTASGEYFKRLNDKHSNIRKEIEEALEEAERINSSTCLLNKKDKEKLQGFARKVYGYSTDDHAFDFEIIAEKLETNAHHVRTEIASSISSSLSSVVEHKAIAYADDNSSSFDSPLACYYELNGRTEKTESLLRLVEKSKDVDYIAQASRLFDKHSQKKNLRGVNQAMVKINNPSGSPHFFFGDSRIVQDYFTFTCSFSSYSTDSYGDLYYEAETDILTLSMTRYQMMELLQSSLGGNWVKGTLTRFLGEGLSLELKKAPKMIEEPHKIEIPESSETLMKLAAELDSLLSNSSKSKKHKEAILKKVMEISDLFEVESKDRRERFDVTAQTVFNDYAQITSEKINDVLLRFGERLEDKSKGSLSQLLMLINKKN